ncbi:BACON domain-containing protein [Porphyromonas pogonae]|uniref:BACON domain-containing protein n=1 Tax=Porphyromonas pogonae TaxID=867595 RepID=UPI002E779511|nr:BACON domain-containing carbohydrate-binding protein [Porphyromonas pogonae]
MSRLGYIFLSNLCLLSLFFSSCKNEVNPTLNVSPQELFFQASGGESTVDILTDSHSWKWDVTDNWVEVSKIGDRTLKVKASRHDGNSDRKTDILIMTPDLSVKINIKQAAKIDVNTDPALVEFAFEGGVKDVTVNTNAKTWKIIDNPDWIKVSQVENRLKIIASKNNGDEARKGKIELIADGESFSIPVEQDYETVLSITPSQLTFGYKGGVQKAILKVNKKLMRTYKLEGVGGIEAKIMDDGTIEVTADYNTDEKSRNLRLILETKDKKVELIANQDANTIEQEQRQLLKAFYRATNGSSWKRSDNWLSDKPIGEWYGIGTTPGYGVVSITMKDNNLSGTLPSELGLFEYITYMSITNNENLRGNIPPELGKLTKLVNLFLSNNNLTGSIPEELGNAPSLGYLYVQNNRLSGKVPERLLKLVRKALCPQRDGGTFDNYDCGKSGTE